MTQTTHVPADLLADATALADELSALRHDLHRTPEIGLELPLTQARILQALEGLGLEVTTGNALSSVVAVLRGAHPGPAVLLRGDMDALPVTEDSGELFSSEHSGVMHACGHDLHVAGLVGAARLLASRREQLAGSVVFMFQPGEEGNHGARLMIEEGVLDAAGERVGEVTSGTFSPSLRTGIALALLDSSAGVQEGTGLAVDVRGRPQAVQVVKPPFVESHVR